MRRTLLDLLHENKTDKSFPSKKPDTIYFSDDLPSLCKENISKRPITELESELFFSWRETPDVFRQTDNSVLTVSDTDLIIEKHLSFPDKLLSKLCLHKMSNAAGMSVFAKDTMSAGEFLCLYAGELRNPPSQDDHSYPYGCNHFNRLFLTAAEEKKYYRNLYKHSMYSNYKYRKNATGLVDASKSGNISRFMQHLPTDTELKIMDINEKLIPQIATENIEFEDVSYMDQDVMLLRTTRIIMSGEQVGFSYGLDYWLNSRLPFFLFNKKGEPYIKITLRVSYNQRIEIVKEYLPVARKDFDEYSMKSGGRMHITI